MRKIIVATAGVVLALLALGYAVYLTEQCYVTRYPEIIAFYHPLRVALTCRADVEMIVLVWLVLVFGGSLFALWRTWDDYQAMKLMRPQQKLDSDDPSPQPPPRSPNPPNPGARNTGGPPGPPHLLHLDKNTRCYRVRAASETGGRPC